MRIANNINGAPETELENTHGVHSDENTFYFFDSDLEREQFISAIPVQWSIGSFTNQLSAAFDAKFETHWKAKGYTDTTDLLSHAANPDSVYHAEALSLVQWSHDEWEVAISDLNENSNIEEIINGLEPYA